MINFRKHYKDFFKRVYEKAFENDVFNVSAQVAFYFSFALFPLLLFLVSLFGLIIGSADELRGELFFYLRQIMPFSAFELVRDTIKEVTQSSSSGKLTIGILIAYWSASAGFDSIRNGLNSVYGLQETRAWWKTKLQSLLFTLVLTILIIIAMAIVFYGWKTISLMFTSVGLPLPSRFWLIVIQWIVVLILLLTVFGIIYNFAPSYKSIKLIWLTPGSIVGVILWLILSTAFRLYLQYFNTYNRTYGSLGAVIILLLWLYLTALVILIGGVINSVLKEMSEELAEVDIENNERDIIGKAIENIEEKV